LEAGSLSVRRQLPNPNVFDEISDYWSEMSYVRSTQEQVNFVIKHVERTGSVLDLGCGNGRHAVPLAKAGYEVVGLDISVRQLQKAQNKAAEAKIDLNIVRADMRQLPFHTGAFSLVASLDTSFGYFSNEADALQTLLEATRVLSQQGLLILDVFNRERMLQRHVKSLGLGLLPFIFRLMPRFRLFWSLFTWREYPSFYLLQHRRVSINGGMLIDIWVFRGKKTGNITIARHEVQLYSLSDLRKLLGATKLQIEQICGSYTGGAYTMNSDRLLLISRKAPGLGGELC
jgi:SAM-dependent methyltransferase